MVNDTILIEEFGVGSSMVNRDTKLLESNGMRARSVYPL